LYRQALIVSTIIAIIGTSAAGTNKPVSLLAKHRVWMQKGLAWEHPEGGLDPQEAYANGTVLYFGADGKFGMFSYNIVRNGKRLGLDEGDGGRIFSGSWTFENDAIKISYRLVDAYKLILPKEQQPQVPGPVEERRIPITHLKSMKDSSTAELVLDRQTFQASPAFRESSLRDFLRVYDRQKGK